jgi:predicted RNA binding protein YcfA (HicA-like mRNA interferase family)
VPDIAIMNDRETEIVVQSGVLEAGAKGSHRYFENIAIQRIVIATMEAHLECGPGASHMYNYADAKCVGLPVCEL